MKKRGKGERDRDGENDRLSVSLDERSWAKVQDRAERRGVTAQDLIREMCSRVYADAPTSFTFTALESAAIAAEDMRWRLNDAIDDLLQRVDGARDVTKPLIALDQLRSEVDCLRAKLDGDH